ncbi:hypothetical protein [Sinorhizobium chiapasense]|uniref:Uncharacterized protein n=1 Tax=Sinorhizobium chiapasense TaxID=501572 RepID=A0ABZ2BNG3_9HYPH
MDTDAHDGSPSRAAGSPIIPTTPRLLPVGGAILGWAGVQSFDGTLTPVIASLCIFGACVLACFLVAEKDRLFGDERA